MRITRNLNLAIRATIGLALPLALIGLLMVITPFLKDRWHGSEISILVVMLAAWSVPTVTLSGILIFRPRRVVYWTLLVVGLTCSIAMLKFFWVEPLISATELLTASLCMVSACWVAIGASLLLRASRLEQTT